MKTIIFDFDGTIADTLLLTVRIANQLAAEYGFKKITGKDILRLRDKTYTDIFKELRALGISLLRLPFILKEGKDRMTKQIAFCKPFARLPETLMFLKKEGFRLGIITSNLKKNVELFLQKNNLRVFDFIYCDNSAFLLGKGNKLKKLIEKNRWRHDEVIYVGDEVRDIEAAKEAGIKIISVGWGFNSKEILEKQKPDFFINKPEELKNLKF